MKTILIYSGGLDSTVMLGVLSKVDEVKALSIDYGQRHRLELDAAATICRELNVEHRVANLASLTQFMAGSSQTDPDVPVPHGHYEAENMKLTVVPNRNMLMLAVAGAWAISLKYDAIAYAAHAGDHAIYPDCREEFVRPLADALWYADWHRVQLIRPFIGLTKADIVTKGHRAGIEALMAKSYSCYEGNEVHCGKCGTCTERREAFAIAAVPDLTTYQT